MPHTAIAGTRIPSLAPICIHVDTCAVSIYVVERVLSAMHLASRHTRQRQFEDMPISSLGAPVDVWLCLYLLLDMINVCK